MRIAIVDDMKVQLMKTEEILYAVGKEKDISFDISCFDSEEDFLDNFTCGCFDIVFMDIYMEKMTGIEAAQIMRELDSSCILVFMTTSMEHMIDAFSCHAYDYINKPVSHERILSLITDVIRFRSVKEKFIEFICNRQTVRLMYSDFLSAVSSEHYLTITDSDENVYKTRMKLSSLAKRLSDDNRFLQINKGVLVNMDFVLSFENSVCVMKNKVRMPVKVRDSSKIKDSWLNYSFEQIRTGQKKVRNNDA
jgi:DNA-binding LytR/AlgR family response regulator